MGAPTLSFFKAALAIQDLFNGHVNSRISPSVSTKKASLGFDRDCTEAVGELRECSHLNQTNSSNPWTGGGLPLT